MKHTPQIAALGALLCLAVGGAAHAQQTGPGNVHYEADNLTFSGGGAAPDGSEFIASDVTFERLFLTEKFSDGFTDRVSLFDANGAQYAGPGTPQPAPGLDTGTLSVFSNNFFDPNPTHGALTLATLTGIFDNGLGQGSGFDAQGNPIYLSNDLESVDVYTDNTINGPTNNVDVFAGFTASLVNPVTGQLNSQAPIYAIDANNNGAKYEAGVFSLQAAPAPEPSPLAPLGLGALGLGALGVVSARRRAVGGV